MNIYVANLSFDIRDEDLRGLFTPYGDVSSAKVIMDKVTSRSRGFGFVEMSDDAAAQKAITDLDKTTVQNRQINVNEAKPKEEKSYGGGGSSRGGNSGGGGYNNSSSYNNTRY
jgi:RNA recognition motif-containing protein